jgi:hypothetical protein
MAMEANSMTAAPPLPSRKTRSHIPKWLLGCLAFGIFWLYGQYAIHVRHPLGADLSPDGKLRAEYFWQYHYFIDWVIQYSGDPTLHLDVRETSNGRVVIAEDFWADDASFFEARDRFRDKIPWDVESSR